MHSGKPVLFTTVRDNYCVAVSLGGTTLVPGSRVTQVLVGNIATPQGAGDLVFLSRFGDTLLVALFVPLFLLCSFLVD